MKWASTVQSGANASEILQRCADRILSGLEGATPDLLFVFVTPHFARDYDHLPALIEKHVGAKVVLGCSGGGVIGGGRELEGQPAISLTAATLPGVTLHPFYTDTEDLPDEDAPPEVWKTWLGMDAPGAPGHAVILADPFTALIEPFVAGLDYAFPDGRRLGGLASGGRRPGENAIFYQQQVFRQGLVAVGLSGDLAVDALVSQGCRPLGEPLVVTRCQQNTLFEVNHESPLVFLNRVFQGVDERERELMRSSLFLGIQVGEQAPFLIRNLLGADYQHGQLQVGAYLHEGQVVQFHLRDRATSAEDLTRHLDDYARTRPDLTGAGVLLFSCLGRGHYLYGAPHHDSESFCRQVGELPLGGFFCNGEIGPVGAATYIHGYTSAFGIFRPATPPTP